MKTVLIRLGKKSASFVRELGATPKGIVILTYLALCGVLFLKFADKELLSNPLQFLTIERAPAL